LEEDGEHQLVGTYNKPLIYFF